MAVSVASMHRIWKQKAPTAFNIGDKRVEFTATCTEQAWTQRITTSAMAQVVVRFGFGHFCLNGLSINIRGFKRGATLVVTGVDTKLDPRTEAALAHA